MGALDEDFDRDVSLFYSIARESDVLYLEEINAAAAAHPSLHPHIVNSSSDGYLTAERVVTGVSDVTEVWVYMCGPPAMMTGLAKGFRQLRIPADQVRWEQFSLR